VVLANAELPVAVAISHVPSGLFGLSPQLELFVASPGLLDRAFVAHDGLRSWAVTLTAAGCYLRHDHLDALTTADVMSAIETAKRLLAEADRRVDAEQLFGGPRNSPSGDQVVSARML
jgi:hypothetical protein